MRRLVSTIVLLLVSSSAIAQQAGPPSPMPASPPAYTITATDQQIDALIMAGAQCENRVPYACSEYLVYIRNWLNDARKPKPVASVPPPSPPKVP